MDATDVAVLAGNKEKISNSCSPIITRSRETGADKCFRRILQIATQCSDFFKPEVKLFLHVRVASKKCESLCKPI